MHTRTYTCVHAHVHTLPCTHTAVSSGLIISNIGRKTVHYLYSGSRYHFSSYGSLSTLNLKKKILPHHITVMDIVCKNNTLRFMKSLSSICLSYTHKVNYQAFNFTKCHPNTENGMALTHKLTLGVMLINTLF